MQSLEDLVSSAQADFTAAADAAALENAKAKYLGKTGQVTDLMKGLGKLDPEQRKAQGALINAAKEKIEQALTARRDALANAQLEARLNLEAIDVTLPGRGRAKGGIHPVMRTWERVEQIFRSIGFDVADGPEIETDWTNFTALNSPENHPARSMQDTFYIEGNDSTGKPLLLRTHTSPMQVRYARTHTPPIKVIAPGRTYRVDSDATHSPMFHQVEGLVIDKKSNVANMRWILEEFCKTFFEVPSVTMRFRPSFFPFTEPSFEVDIQCDRSGPIVKFGEGTDWMEILGCGMVHPNVLRSGGLDPDEYQGFAWGMGLDRIAMLKYGMPDLRDFFNADVRWMNHYGFRPLDMPTLFGGLSQ